LPAAAGDFDDDGDPDVALLTSRSDLRELTDAVILDARAALLLLVDTVRGVVESVLAGLALVVVVFDAAIDPGLRAIRP
jgi:hypothetical protein